MPKISELPIQSTPSASAVLAGVDNGENVQIPFSSIPGGPYIHNVAHGGHTLQYLIEDLTAQGYTSAYPLLLKLTGNITGAYTGYINFESDGSNRASFELNEIGTGTFYKSDTVSAQSILLTSIFQTEDYKRDVFAEVDNLKENSGTGDSGSSNSIPYTTFGCYSTNYTVMDLIVQLTSEGFSTVSGIPIIVNFVGMLSGTFLCRLNNYYGEYYGCEFTDLKNIDTYYFEGQAPALFLYENINSVNLQLSLTDLKARVEALEGNA